MHLLPPWMLLFPALRLHCLKQQFCLALCLLLGFASAAQAEPWPIKEFEVVPGTPWEYVPIPGGTTIAENSVLGPKLRELGIGVTAIRVDWLAPQLRKFGIDTDRPYPATPPLTLELKKEMEAYLKDVANALEAYGFPPPALEPIVETLDGRRAYRLYYANLVSGRSHYESPYDLFAFSPPERVIILHPPNIVDNGRISNFGYGTLAHELFHAVQYATPFYLDTKHSDVGAWITEGQAAAIGYDLARRLRGVVFSSDHHQQIEHYWGQRDYTQPLPVPANTTGLAKTIAYNTSSFWRYLAELDDARRPGGPWPPPKPDAGPVDYRYLALLLKRTPSERSDKGELAWLDSGLARYDRFGYGLRRAYPEFASVYSAYSPNRSVGPPVGDPDTGKKAWLLESFADAMLAELNPQQRRVRLSLRVDRVASRLIVVELSGLGQEVGVDVQIETSSPALLRQLAISLPGGQRVATPITSGVDPETGTVRTRWSLRMTDTAVGSNNLIVTNVAPQAETTFAQTISVVVSVGGKEVNNTAEPDDGTDAVSPSPTGKGSQDAANSAAQRLERASGRMASNGPLGQTLQRDETEPFMSIVLQPQPDTFGVISEVNASGGLMAQLLASGELMNEAGPAGMMRGVVQALSGEQITITIPRLDYGFTGTIRDAGIRVETPAGGPRLEARGPADSDPTALVYFPHSGQVTIDEYSQEFMSGSFTGKLIDPDDNPTQSRDRIVVAKVVRPIAGRFWISSPWLADSRFETIEPDQGEFRTDIIPRLPSELAEAAEDAAGAAADGDGDSSDEASADLDELIEMGAEIGCDCSCEGKRRSQMLLTEMRSGTAPVSAEQFTLASCMSLCAAVYAGCP